MKLAKLESKVSVLDTRRVAPVAFAAESVQRLRGRAGVARRARWLRHHPLCVECKKEGRTTAATVPDHVLPLIDGGPDTEANLQSLCKAHHDVKTAREAAERGRRARLG